ncbi:MAG: fibronectin type III domain-containing protein [Actinobacteria bacterium]|nr:fibronectin type III domain-containing protein [Actinomycetota bacterium]
MPAAPTNLVASVKKYNRVDLTWVDHSSTEDGFRVEYCTPAPNTACNNSGPWAELGTTGANVTSFSDTPPLLDAITGSSWRSYRVFAVKGTISSDPSNIATVHTPAGPPTGDLSAVANGKRRIDVSWTYAGPTPQYFILEYAGTPSGSWAELSHPAAGATYWNDTYALNPGQQRCYRLRSFFSSTGASDPSNVACAVTDPPNVPARPSNLVLDPADSVHIDLTWNDNANNEQGFKIDRSDDGGQTYRTIKTLTTPCALPTPCTGANASYTDGVAPVNGHLYGLQPNTQYCYRVRAYNEDGDSASFPDPNLPNEQKVCATTPALPKPAWVSPRSDMQNQVQPYTCSIHGTAQYNSGVREVQVAIINLTDGSTVTKMTTVVPAHQEWYVIASSAHEPYPNEIQNNPNQANYYPGSAVYAIPPGRYNLTARSHLNVNGKDFYSENVAVIGWILPADSIPC